MSYHFLDETDEEEPTISSASLCMSPSGGSTGAPLYASTPMDKKLNGYHEKLEHLDNSRDCDTLNGNVHENIVSASTNNMDVLSGGESDAGDTLTRRNNNSISSGVALTCDTIKKRGADITYHVAKELLMTERTYKRDLELITVTWSKQVGTLGRTASGGAEAAALARACLALEPLALPAGALLARLERVLNAATPDNTEEPDWDAILALPAAPFVAYLDRVLSCIELPIIDDSEEPEYKKIADILHDHLSNTFDAYSEYTRQVGATVARAESARRRGGDGARLAAAFDRAAPLPLSAALLRPLHRLHHYQDLAAELSGARGVREAQGVRGVRAAEAQCGAAVAAADRELRHVENHALLCQLQRDLAGYDKLLVAEREFVRLGCVYTHTSKGLQQRMLFLFNDILILASKSTSGQFRALTVLPLQDLTIDTADLPHSLTIINEDSRTVVSTSNEAEHASWRQALQTAVHAAHHARARADTLLTPPLHDHDEQPPEEGGGGGGGGGSSGGGGGGGALVHVCWHRTTSLGRDQLHLAMRSQLSGYLLRKFKNSHGWQKLWVVFALFTLYFYKTCRDQSPLASLPLLGCILFIIIMFIVLMYSVGAPAPSDGIDKDFVFKLQFKNHVYFFRADSHYTYKRWIEVLQTPMAPQHN